MHLYLHIPFCASKCPYCGFYSIVRDGIGDYARLPAIEAQLRPADFPDAPKTIYFGGGTPSLLGPDGFEALVASLRDDAGISLGEATEWTVELNPASTTPELLRAMRRAGVNRLSIGAQSLCDATLVRIGRIHDADAVRRGFSLARAEGFDDIGLDLIANLPGVSVHEWRETISDALRLKPVHISVYSLIIEEGTPFASAADKGTLGQRLDDDAEMDLLSETEDRLSSEGFVRYEISNYALPDRECRHNLGVWRGEDYTGLGPAASSRNGLVRRTNAPDLDGYRKALAKRTLPPAAELDTLTPDEDAKERFIYGLRTWEGVSPQEFAMRYPAAKPFVAEWENRLAVLSSLGLAEPFNPSPLQPFNSSTLQPFNSSTLQPFNPSTLRPFDPSTLQPFNSSTLTSRWRLTPRGFEVCDSVLTEFA